MPIIIIYTHVDEHLSLPFVVHSLRRRWLFGSAQKGKRDAERSTATPSAPPKKKEGLSVTKPSAPFLGALS
ncbi:MAG: hypothetical protein WC763_06310 [Candidatus Paceibacterota bacterium]|jgi:hypothetical protein